MKARIFTTALLMIVALTTYAQTSRRSERGDKKQETTREKRSTENKESKREVKPTESRTKDSKQAESSRTNTTQRTREGNNSDQKSTESRRGNTSRETEAKQAESSRTTTTNRSDERSTSDDRRGDNRREESTRTSRQDNSRDRVVVNNQPQRHVTREYVHINRAPRKVVVVNHSSRYTPHSVEYRRVHYPYRAPVHREIIWSVNFHNDFRGYYPEVRHWRYETGYRIPGVSAYDAFDYIGEVASVYGKVYDMHYEPESDDYYLYFGDYYPYHDFTVIVPGREARAISRRPMRYFRRANVTVTGYITAFEDKPEMVIRNARQMEVY